MKQDQKNSQKAETSDSINIWLFNQERRENGFVLANQDRKKEVSVQLYFQFKTFLALKVLSRFVRFYFQNITDSTLTNQAY